MDEQIAVWLSDLAEVLETRQRRVVDRWIKACEADSGLPVVSKLTRDEFRNNIPAALKGLARVLRRPESIVTDAIRHEVAKHGYHRWKQGFSLRELIRDWGNLNRALVAEVETHLAENPAPNAEARQEAFDRLAAYMTEAMSQSVVRFDELRETEAQALTQDLEKAQVAFDRASEARSNLLREATHDLGGSLSAVELTATALKKRLTVDDSFLSIMQNLEESIQSVRQMFDSMLDLARLESGQDPVELREVDVCTVLRRLVDENQPQAEERGLELRAEGPSTLLVSTDPHKVRRIAQNLLLNALQHTVEGYVRVAWECGARCWLLRVEDTGPGLQETDGCPLAQELDEDDHAESPATGGGYRGEGIGLTIVKRLCEQLDAGISLESEKGKGTIFTVQFPMESPEA